MWPLWDSKRMEDLPAVLAEAETLARTVPDLAIRAEVLSSCAAMQAFIGRSDAAKLTADEALGIAQASRDAWTIAMAAWARALTAGSAEEWRARIDEAAPLLAGVGNAHNLNALYCLAVGSAWRRGCDAEAAMYLDRSIPLARHLQQPSQWLHALNNIGLAALLRDDSTAADEAFREALLLGHDLRLSPRRALTGLAAVAALQGRPERAARLAGVVAAHLGATEAEVELLRLEAESLEPARLRWGPDTWDASARQGTVLSLQEATVYALRQFTRPPAPPPRPLARRDRPWRLTLTGTRSSARSAAAVRAACAMSGRLDQLVRSGRCADGDHRCAAGVDGVDDLGVVDALQVDGGDAEVAVSELALDDDQRDAFACHLDGVGVAELVRREAPAHAGRGGGAPELRAGGCGCPGSAAGRAVDDAEQRVDGEFEVELSQGWSSCQPQLSMPTSRRRPPLPRRTSSEPRRWSRSASVSASASWTRSPARQRTTIRPRSRRPCAPSPAARITAMISSTFGGSAG